MNSFATTTKFLEWQRDLNVQASGFAGWCLMVALGVGVLLLVRWRWRNPTSNPRLIARFVVMGLFLGTLALLLPWKQVLALMIPAASVGAIGYGWLRYFRQGSAKIAVPHLPPIVWIVAGGAALRVPMLFIKPIWYDETFTASVVSRSLPEMWRVIQSDVHPPLWYLIEWINTRLLGTSPAALRFPAFVFGVACIYLVYRLARSLTNERAALISAGLTAILPAALLYSDDARMYALLAMLVLLAAVAIVEDKPKLFMVATPLIPLTQSLGYLHLLILWLVAYLFMLRLRVLRAYSTGTTHTTVYTGVSGDLWFWAFSPSAVAAVAWLPFMVQQTKDVANGFWLTFSPSLLLTPLNTMVVGFGIPDRYLLHITALWLGLLFVSLFFMRRSFKTIQGQSWLLLTLGAPALAALVSLVWHPVYLDRAFLVSGLLLTVPCGLFLSEVNKGDRLTALVIIVPALLIGVLSYYDASKFYDYAPLIAKGCQGADSIFETKVAGRILSAYYSPLPQVLWSQANDETQTLTDDAKQALGWQIGDISSLRGHTVCVLDWYTVHNRPDADAYTTQLLQDYPPVSQSRLVDEEFFHLYAYVVKVP
jgi:hypothetical protein